MSNRWAVLIGIDHYHESLGSLKYAGADCRALRDTLVSAPLGFPEDQVLLLDDTQDAEHRPTFANIHSFLGSWLAAPKEDDLVFVYFAGHGRLVDGKTYLVPGDATLASIHTLGIPLRQVQDVMERCKAKRKVLVLDACHSGSGRDVAVMAEAMQDAIAQGTGIYTISSCGAKELSHEWDEKGHGVFSHFLAAALRGDCAPSADGRLTVDRLYEWVHDRVAKWAAQHRCSQTPQRFARGAGTVVLAESAPDHVALAEQYRRELEETKARLAEIELREAREQLAQQGRQVEKAVATGGQAVLRLAIVPASVDSRIYLDDELLTGKNKPITLPHGSHSVRVVPASLEWGTETTVVTAKEGEHNKVVVRLRRAASTRALVSCVCTVLVGGLVALLGLVMPASPCFGASRPDPYVMLGFIVSFGLSLLFAWLLAGVIRSSRGLQFKMLPVMHDRFSTAWDLDPPDGLLGLLAIATTYAGWGLGFVLPFRYLFMGWAVGTAALAGVLFCLFPWHGHYRNRDVI